MTVKSKILGFLFLIIAILFSTGETLFFGGNLFPVTWQEWTCDIISLVFLSFAISLFTEEPQDYHFRLNIIAFGLFSIFVICLCGTITHYLKVKHQIPHHNLEKLHFMVILQTIFSIIMSLFIFSFKRTPSC